MQQSSQLERELKEVRKIERAVKSAALISRNREIVALWRAGKTIPQLSVEYNLTTVMVRLILKKASALKPKPANATKLERNNEVVKMREAGATFQEISEKYQISRNRAFQICKKAKRHADKQNAPSES